MKIFLTLLFIVGLVSSCDDSLLIVGGQDSSGPLSSLSLLTPSGWCQNINLPSLPEPVVSPAVHLFTPDNSVRNIIIVCGFVSQPCMWSESGAGSWHSLPIQELHEGTKDIDFTSSQVFKIVSLDSQSLVLVSTKDGDNYAGHTHTNRLDWFPNPWLPAEDQTAEFTLDGTGAHGHFTKNLTGSCLVRLGQELLLTGGRTSKMPMDFYNQQKHSDASVGRMSPEGGVHCDDECGPQWESHVVPDLTQEREEHSCLNTRVGGEEVVMVGGGYKYDYIWGKSGWNYYVERETYETLKSIELYDGAGWSTGGEFKNARAEFGLAELCGDLLAMGGRQYDGTYQWERVYNGPPDCGDPCWEETVTDTTTETFLDSMEVATLGAWLLHDLKLPQKMANFGVAKAPASMCVVG